MRLDRARLHRLIEAAADHVTLFADDLTALDQAIGDGDHGINMRRGLEAVRKDIDALSSLAVPDALASIGSTFVMTMGGASGPLYGTLLIALGKAMPAAPDLKDAAAAFGHAIAATKARGRSGAGDKTLLDVLIPLQQALAEGESDPVALRRVAASATAATQPMQARRGRASYLGPRSIGHVDPGARSAEILFCAVLDAFDDTR